MANLSQTDYIHTLSISIARPYTFLGISKLADGTTFEIEPLFVPDNYFAFESLQAAINRGPDLTATNNIRTSPEFFYANDIEMNFMPGYDEFMLTTPHRESGQHIFPCILPVSFIKEHDLHLGDTIRVAIDEVLHDSNYEQRIFQHFDLQVVGSYSNQGPIHTIYTPLALFFDTRLIWGENPAGREPFDSESMREAISAEEKDMLQSQTFQSTNFTLKKAQALSEFKDYLTDYGYSQVQKIGAVREFIVLNDASFNAAIASVKQQILYIQTLYPFLYALAGIIAFVVSYLLVVSRKKEFATMRGLGGTRLHTFFSFFLEQALLAFFGTAAGLVVWLLIRGAVTTAHLLFTAGFLGFYFLGCTLSIRLMNRANVLTILLDKD